MRYSVNKELMESVTKYLMTKPFIEVAGLLNKLQADIKDIIEEETKSK